jgi:Probable Zinc-ribbon domain
MPSLWSLDEDGRRQSHPPARLDARGLPGGIQLRENVPTCAAGVSGSLRRSATARIGRGGFGSPPAGAGGSVRPTPQWRSLGRLHPHLAAQLHPGRNGHLDVGELAAGSKRKLWWLCGRCGHAWQATVDNRVAGKSGCPMCAIERRQQPRPSEARTIAGSQALRSRLRASPRPER